MILHRPLLGNDHSRRAQVQSVVDMLRIRPQSLRELCRGLVKRPPLVLPAVHDALAQGLIRRTESGYEVAP